VSCGLAAKHLSSLVYFFFALLLQVKGSVEVIDVRCIVQLMVIYSNIHYIQRRKNYYLISLRLSFVMLVLLFFLPLSFLDLLKIIMNILYQSIIS
jgi:hypothetical protein